MTQDTKSKDDISAPIGFLIVFLAIAMAFGAAGGIGGGGGGRSGSDRGAAPGPCDGKPDDTVVRSWTVEGKLYRLRCRGYRYITEEKGRRFGGRAYDCIEKVLTRGKPGPPERGKVEYDYRHPKGRAKVIVVRATGDVINAYVRRSTWSDCATS